MWLAMSIPSHSEEASLSEGCHFSGYLLLDLTTVSTDRSVPLTHITIWMLGSLKRRVTHKLL